jgi:GNAT superfamily N-acetyltransferase
METSIKVALITAEQTWDLRHRILRPDLKIYQPNPEDKNPTTFHVGAFGNNKILGIASFQIESYPELKAQNPYRLRGMATERSEHQKGIGRQVLNYGIEELLRRKCDLLWFNARQIAFPFYEKMGFDYCSDFFEIPHIGPHKVMYKYLQSENVSL